MSTKSFYDLSATLKGRIIAPGDAEYDRTRTLYYGGFDRRPAVIVRAADASDVVRTVCFARETGTELAVRCGGHSTAGHSTSEGGIVLDLRGLKTLKIDGAARTAWAGAGLTAGELTKATAAHGLAVGFGDTGSVGIGGITLGGGIGYLLRKHGLTIDSLLAADIVTADGELLRVDAATHPDLFWAIRGGGGNFGVVTRFKFQLHDVTAFIGGMLVLPATPDVIARFMAEMETAPDELSSIANVVAAPPMPFIPAEAHGKMAVMAFFAYTGSIENGQRVLAPFRAIATPIVDMVRPMGYVEMYPPDEEMPFHPSLAARSMFVDSVDRGAAERILERLQPREGVMLGAQLRMLGGAMARVPSHATAFAHRSSKILLNFGAFFPGTEGYERHQQWAAESAASLRQSDPGVYVNFLCDEGESRVRAAYPGATWDRLVAVKRRYDPTNLFRRNQNIAPATEGDRMDSAA